MDSEQFNAPPTTTAALVAYFRRYGDSAAATATELVHFQSGADIAGWLARWRQECCQQPRRPCNRLSPVVGFSFTWNAAEFLPRGGTETTLPGLLVVAGGPHVQQAGDYLGIDPIDVIFLGEVEVSFQQFLDCRTGPAGPISTGWHSWTAPPWSPRPPGSAAANWSASLSTDVLTLTDATGAPLYESIACETSRGCPFKCAFCEWGTGAIGSKMYQWPCSESAMTGRPSSQPV